MTAMRMNSRVRDEGVGVAEHAAGVAAGDSDSDGPRSLGGGCSLALRSLINWARVWPSMNCIA